MQLRSNPSLRTQRGQGMTEYILLVALIAIACIAAVKYFGSKTKEGFQTAGDAVGGVNQGMKDAANGNGGSN
ncbi:MAG TPA: hypothetical protein VNZ54_09205 [bacterium]|jgi:Flp pilus assembly pilin Flp|nr:hypothetical protein [bacterium]